VIAPLEERLKPAGRFPEERLQLNGGVPPATSVLRSNEYAAPSVAAGRALFAGGVITGVASTVTELDAVLLLSATEVAVIVTLALLAGAV
jgi:hypothetical protein